MSEKVRVVVVISGGTCQAVYAGRMVEVVVFDQDDHNEDPDNYWPLIEPADEWDMFADGIWDNAVIASNRA